MDLYNIINNIQVNYFLLLTLRFMLNSIIFYYFFQIINLFLENVEIEIVRKFNSYIDQAIQQYNLSNPISILNHIQ